MYYFRYYYYVASLLIKNTLSNHTSSSNLLKTVPEFEQLHTLIHSSLHQNFKSPEINSHYF